MKTENLALIMNIARGKAPADLLIRNARVVNVFTKQIEEMEVAVGAGTIAWVGNPIRQTARKPFTMPEEST